MSVTAPLSACARLVTISLATLALFVGAILSGLSSAIASPVEVKIGYLGKQYEEPEPLSLVDKIVTDKGIQGARIGLKENNVTGRLIGQDYKLIEAIVAADDDVSAKARDLIANGIRLIVADLEPTDLLAVSDLPEAHDAIFFNVRASDDKLRLANCRASVFHIVPSNAMRADGLAQYLIWKRWHRWALISGTHPKDIGYRDAIRRAAKRFGGKIVAEKTYAFDGGSRRTDTGHQQIQTQMPLLTQDFPNHDVIIVADVDENFGEYLLFRTYEPRPVAGTHGLLGVSWHRSYEQSAATQMQNRFEKHAGRIMLERDYSAWLAVRAFGEAVLRTSSTNVKAIREYLLGEEFQVAGFKSQGLNFRSWNRQLRQPVLIAGPRALVSISPQEGFLHPDYLTDTLGYDKPENTCPHTN